jgi:hypothetical protein
MHYLNFYRTFKFLTHNMTDARISEVETKFNLRSVNEVWQYILKMQLL